MAGGASGRTQREMEFENLLRDDQEDRILNFDGRAARGCSGSLGEAAAGWAVIDLRDAMIAALRCRKMQMLATRKRAAL